MDRFIDSCDEFALRFRVPISVVSVTWFALSCASFAQFVELPDFALFNGLVPVFIGVAINAIWWGALYPRVEARRKSRVDYSRSDESTLVDG